MEHRPAQGAERFTLEGPRLVLDLENESEDPGDRDFTVTRQRLTCAVPDAEPPRCAWERRSP